MIRAVLGVLLVACVAGPAAAEGRADPDPKLTPGKVDAVTAKQVCQPGYATRTRLARPVPERVWAEIARTYGEPVTAPAGTRQRDHFIPLELGGCPDCPANLWYQYADPRPGFMEKDWVEHTLHVLVCAGLLDLDAAQGRIKSWLAIWVLLHGAPATPWGTPAFGAGRP